MIDLVLIMTCAPNVHPITIKEIIRVESAGNPIALNINVKDGVRLRPTKKIKTVRDAAAVAHAAIKRGHTVDIGYMQINSVNLPKLGYTVEDMFDPCKNISAGARILERAYLDALPKHKNKQAALRAALSAYNTGSFTRGFENGYVSRFR